MDRFTSFKPPADEEKGFFSRLLGRFTSSSPPSSPTTRSGTSEKAVGNGRVSASELAASKAAESPSVRRPSREAEAVPAVSEVLGGGSGEYAPKEHFRMKNESASVCYQCDAPFSVLKPRKHCFACGQIFCGKCTRRTESASLKLPKSTPKLIVRVCLFCYDTLHKVTPPTHASEAMPIKSATLPINHPTSMVRNGRSSTNLANAAALGILDAGHLDLDASDEDEAIDGVGDEEEELLSKTYKRISIRNLKALMSSSKSDLDDLTAASPASPSTATNSALPSPTSELSGQDKSENAIDSVASTEPSSDSDSSSEEGFDDLGREQMEEDTFNKWFSRPVAPSDDVSPLSDPPLSDSNLPLGLKTPTRSTHSLAASATIPGPLGSNTRPLTGTRVHELAHSDLVRRFQHKSLSRPHFAVDSRIALPTTPEVKSERVQSHSLLAGQDVRDEDSQVSVHESAFRALSIGHLEYICELLLDKFGIEKRWKSKIVSFADQAVVNLKIQVKNGDSMDVLQYMKVKSIPGSSLDECEYVEGFVFESQRTKRQMPSQLTNARVLLLGCSLEYERRENVLLSIDKVLQQEREYLNLLVAKVATVNPHIIFVEKNVSIVAQQMLADKGICLLVNIKPHTLQVISRLTGATILQSTDHVSPTTVGKCPSFSIDSYLGPWGQKHCVTVKGQSPNLFGTVLLRGAPDPILKRVKQTLQFLIYSAYNMVLENHLLFEQTATTLEDAHVILRTKTALALAGLSHYTPTSPTRVRAGSDAVDPLQSKKYVENVFATSAAYGSAPPKSKSPGALDYDGKLISASWSVAIPKEEKQAKSSANRDTVYHVCPSILLPPVHPDLKQTCECRTDQGAYEVPAPLGPSINFSYRSLLVPNEQLCSDPEIPTLPPPPKNARPTAAYNQINHLRKKRIHAFKAFSPQHLIYLHALYSPATNMQCLPYTPQVIHFYSANDMTLGQFLENFCFNDRSRCRNEECHRPTSEHERCILHANGRINIAVRPFDITKALSNLSAATSSGDSEVDPTKILMWANCKNLQRQTPYMVPMSRETWNFSLGKFFELIFYSAHTRCRTCNEPPYRGHIRYFYFNGKVVMFEYEDLKAYETCIPPMQLSLDTVFARQLMQQEIDEVVKCSDRMYEAVLAKVVDLEDASTKLDDEEELRSVTIMHRSLEEEKAQFNELVLKERHAVEHIPSTTIFQVTRLRRLFYFNIRRWNDTVSAEEARVQKKWKAFVAAVKEKEKQEAKERDRLEKEIATAKRVNAASPYPKEVTADGGVTTTNTTTTGVIWGSESKNGGADADGREDAPTSTDSRRSSMRSRSGSVDETSVTGRSRSSSASSSANNSLKLALPANSLLAPNSSTSNASSGSISPGSGRLAPIPESSQPTTDFASKESPKLQQDSMSSKSTSQQRSASGSGKRDRANSNPNSVGSGPGSTKDVAGSASSGPTSALTIPLVRPQGSSSQEILFDQIGSPPPAALLVVPQLNYTTHALLKSSSNSVSTGASNSAYGSLNFDEVDSVSSEGDPLSGGAPQSSASTTPLDANGPLDMAKGKATQAVPVNTPSSQHPLHSSTSSLLSTSVPRDTTMVPPISASPSTSGRDTLVTFGSTKASVEPTSRFREALSMVLPQKKTQIIDVMNDVEIYIFPPNSNTEPTVAVYENEPSSIIAYSLMSDLYRDKMLKFDHVPPGMNHATTSSAATNIPPYGVTPTPPVANPQELRNQIQMAASTSTTTAPPVVAPTPTAIVPVPHPTLSDPSNPTTMAQANMNPILAVPPTVVSHVALGASSSSNKDATLSNRDSIYASSSNRDANLSSSSTPALTISSSLTSSSTTVLPPPTLLPAPYSVPTTPTPVELNTSKGEAIVSPSGLLEMPSVSDMSHYSPSPVPKTVTLDETISSASSTPSVGSNAWDGERLDKSERPLTLERPTDKTSGERITERTTGGLAGVATNVGLNSSNSSSQSATASPHLGPKSISMETTTRFEMTPSLEAAYRGLVSPEPTHIDLEWRNTPIWGGPRIQMQCKTYFARQFAWLRSLIGLDEKVFAQSLSRCKPWKARGGKSNSRFARTLDERFILKQVQAIELEGFLAFAPIYFDYFSKVYFQQVPTAICKIVGIFSVTISRKGKSPVKVDLIVQENLFYGHHISKVFDLKGSLRSRYARPESPDDKDVVLMDENLLEMMYGEPICVSNEAKAMLAMTVWNDTLCLSSLNVMDYSLLVGIDETNGKLVLGIIDYMRTYTWDKQLETWVKRTGILGGISKSKIPTIISPKQYKKRFRLAIWAYFLLIPNLNTKLIYEFIASANDKITAAITKK